MASKDIVVTVSEGDWLTLRDAAECAGMSVPAYVRWGVRLLALRAGPGGSERRDIPVPPRASHRTPITPDEPESTAWTETFAERLSHRADTFHID
ncbi:hypothetical protein IU474_10705 [Nocardia otitidiscaviarum]|uniref:hypothetical protein n=1 Tax=Nocardia otitidiscaviarum TaxID=1823 RepID=UPI00189347B8|nr:hypothetical protein [Nocardia otitidiscaviarum]MBF6237539.1 hypothetical protein [Nocardia otitidiscaviarum]